MKNSRLPFFIRYEPQQAQISKPFVLFIVFAFSETSFEGPLWSQLLIIDWMKLPGLFISVSGARFSQCSFKEVCSFIRSTIYYQELILVQIELIRVM